MSQNSETDSAESKSNHCPLKWPKPKQNIAVSNSPTNHTITKTKPCRMRGGFMVLQLGACGSYWEPHERVQVELWLATG